MVSNQSSDKWRTPRKFWEPLHASLGFTLDIAAESGWLLPRWWGPGGEVEDALITPWPTNEIIWCNPPYSRGFQKAFVEQAIECERNHGRVVMLLPADTSTELFHFLKDRGTSYDLIKGRLRFDGAPGPAKFGSVLWYFGW